MEAKPIKAKRRKDKKTGRVSILLEVEESEVNFTSREQKVTRRTDPYAPGRTGKEEAHSTRKGIPIAKPD